jgi:hypothetical protein
VVGLGLWSSGPGLVASVGLEFALLLGGIILYVQWRKTHKSKNNHRAPSMKIER